jgi:hypothetical protein
MPINPKQYAEADNAFREQIAVELQRGTATLNRITSLLHAGLVDSQLLKEFRVSVDRIRETGWIVQQALDSEDPQDQTELLFAHRARAMISLLKQLRRDVERLSPKADVPLPELLKLNAEFLEAVKARDLNQLKG